MVIKVVEINFYYSKSKFLLTRFLLHDRFYWRLLRKGSQRRGETAAMRNSCKVSAKERQRKPEEKQL
jgi:hypothetical protein